MRRCVRWSHEGRVKSHRAARKSSSGPSSTCIHISSKTSIFSRVGRPACGGGVDDGNRKPWRRWRRRMAFHTTATTKNSEQANSCATHTHTHTHTHVEVQQPAVHSSVTTTHHHYSANSTAKQRGMQHTPGTRHKHAALGCVLFLVLVLLAV